ncbi:MAG: DUF2183 domain-containing protein [Ferruginibacter sp.]|nr:DUF2183 domain-containing protein [Cytophagales bacterium]
MAKWKRWMGLASNAEDRLDRLKHRLARRLGRIGPVQIVPYRGFGSERGWYLKGRVLEDKGLKPATQQATVWQNLREMYKRFETDEIPGVRVRARLGELEQVVTTDGEGYFEVRFQPTSPLLPDRVWYEIDLELLDEVVPGQGVVKARGQVLIPPLTSQFGIISDVDDTVLQSSATSKFRMLRLTLLRNARTRLPFEGVAAFYRALQRGNTGADGNPLFYVSSSSWNLYDFLVEFCAVNGIPEGPLLLRDIGFDRENLFRSSHQSHKMAQIEAILIAYPSLPFLLIGDSGQHDPEIYRKVVEDFPGRIRTIYIREVTTELRREQVHALDQALQGTGVQMLLVKDTVEAAAHAIGHGYIHPDAMTEIRVEKKADEGIATDADGKLKK